MEFSHPNNIIINPRPFQRCYTLTALGPVRRHGRILNIK
jgi:hypothetical protein